MLQAYSDRDRHSKSQTDTNGQNKYIIRTVTQTNTGRHNVYEHITHDIIKVCRPYSTYINNMMAVRSEIILSNLGGIEHNTWSIF